MNAQEALKHCQAYLDGQLDDATRAAVEEALARDPEAAKAFEGQRAYHSFLKRTCEATHAPADVQARLAQRIASFAPKTGIRMASASARGTSLPIGRPDLETDRVPVEAFHKHLNNAKRRPIGIRPLALAAAVMLSVSGLVLYQSVCLTGQCPYLNAASVEYQSLERRQDHLAKMSSDPVVLTHYVDERFHLDLPAIPVLTRCTLRPKGACCANFKGIKKRLPDGTPPAAVVCYECEDYGMIALMLHRVKAEASPLAYTQQDWNGKTYFVGEQNGARVVSWRTNNDKLLCTIVGKVALSELLEVAEEAREQLDR